MFVYLLKSMLISYYGTAGTNGIVNLANRKFLQSQYKQITQVNNMYCAVRTDYTFSLSQVLTEAQDGVPFFFAWLYNFFS